MSHSQKSVLVKLYTFLSITIQKLPLLNISCRRILFFFFSFHFLFSLAVHANRKESFSSFPFFFEKKKKSFHRRQRNGKFFEITLFLDTICYTAQPFKTVSEGTEAYFHVAGGLWLFHMMDAHYMLFSFFGQ